MLSQIHILPIKDKKYVLCFAGRKRGAKTYDVLCPNGQQIETRLFWEDAVKKASSHYHDNYEKQVKSRRGRKPIGEPDILPSDMMYETIFTEPIHFPRRNGDIE